ncbi:MAG: 2-hydroxyglutaryl-CoA dehydratase [Chloroflexi bacterium]|nr:2-hydroxyglutaryl-CoA dehydratase [Chloroflexota bacterium]
MIFTAGIDIGTTYTKAVILDSDNQVVGKDMNKTGFKLAEAAREAYDKAISNSGLKEKDIGYVISTGFGRHQIPFSDIAVTDLTASARGAAHLFPNTGTVLDIGGQTMKASRLDNRAKVKSFRLNDKCAAGTGAFLEKTAFYMGYTTHEIGPLVATSKEPMSISGVCAVFAESEVINHLSHGSAPADIMYGAFISLVGRSVQLMKRVKMEPEFTLIGGILRFDIMGKVMQDHLDSEVNVPPGEMAQFVSALGAASLGHVRLKKLKGSKSSSNMQASPGVA